MKTDPVPEMHRHLFPAKGSGAHDLLTVLLGAEHAAREAWDRWQKSHDFDTLDAANHRLLIMALPTLSRYGLPVIDRPRLQGLARRTFCTTMLQWNAVCEISNLLGAEGIPIMIFKGLPLSVALYKPGERYAADADLLIRRSDYQRACAAFDRHQKMAHRHPDRVFNLAIDNGEEWSLGPAQLDIHWRLCHEFTPQPGTEAKIWDRAHPIAGLPKGLSWVHPPLMPAPEDMLLQLAVSQTRWDRGPHGLVDIVKLLNDSGADFDWDLLVEEAIAHRVSLRVAAVLDFVRQNFSAPVGRDQINRLREEALAFENEELKQIANPTRWHLLRWYWFYFRRNESAGGIMPVNAIRFIWFMLKARGKKAPGIAAYYVRRALTDSAK
ncbi:MAG: nucleotidyltransferase family protein [Pseudomonadota bacterium]